MTERDAKMLELYRSGMRLIDIAPMLGISPQYVGARLKQLGVERPSKPQKKRHNVTGDEILDRWNDGLSVSAIMERYGISRQFVVKELHSSGVDLSSSRRHRYDGEGGTARRGGALARIARRA